MTVVADGDAAPRGADGLLAAVRGEGLRPAYQPVVDLQSGDVVGLEALARWPGIPGATPDRVFAEAARTSGLIALDWACRAAAVQGALDAGLGPDVCLFLNAEPAVLARTAPRHAVEVIERAGSRLRVVMELTERSLLVRPAAVLAQVAEARDRGWLIGLDDVGAHPDSLALLDLVAPDVVKLDLALVQRLPARGQARTLAAVMAHRERTGAPVVAEGIETDAHLEQAVALGATLGQGWKLGRPAALDAPPVPRRPLRPQPRPAAAPVTPFDLVAGLDVQRVARKEFLVAFSRHVEAQAHNPADPPVILSALQSITHLTPGTRTRYERLAAAAPLVALFGADVPAQPAAGVRGVALADDDPLRREWTVIALGAQTAAALIARDCGDDGPDADRRFDFVITYDRPRVTRAARSLLSRLAG
ncbi:sensor domain-containing phosphodiesterase [Nakamurella endophytica]|uniref:sensor domain-containing phosphodiesterase n=1 Tax=Nakamurella endophytica TaxID=1748367 RepID=UPI001E331121|nr:EAL domain-containing protein [Nakamurella endophytica]